MTQTIETSLAQLQAHGYVLVQPNAPLEYAVAWDDRIITVSQQRDRAVAMATEQAASQPGRWVAKQRACGPWVDMPVEKEAR